MLEKFDDERVEVKFAVAHYVVLTGCREIEIRCRLAYGLELGADVFCFFHKDLSVAVGLIMTLKFKYDSFRAS